LLYSKVFNVEFDFDNWPGAHTDQSYRIRAYNGNIFDLRDKYDQIFYDLEPICESKNKKGHRVYKIKYSINLLAQVGMYLDENTFVN
jgi:hypothetical protein